MMQNPANYAIFPVINATLNGTSAVLLVVYATMTLPSPPAADWEASSSYGVTTGGRILKIR